MAPDPQSSNNEMEDRFRPQWRDYSRECTTNREIRERPPERLSAWQRFALNQQSRT